MVQATYLQKNTVINLWMKMHEIIRNSREPLLRSYSTDFYLHDRNEIEKRGLDKSFIISLRENGSHLSKFYVDDELPEDGVRVPYYFGHADKKEILQGESGGLSHVLEVCDVKMMIRWNCEEKMLSWTSDPNIFDMWEEEYRKHTESLIS